MSEPVTALGGVASETGIAVITEAAAQGMITLRGDLADSALRTAAIKATGAEMPERGAVTLKDGKGLCWMSPDELLVLCPYADVPDTLAQIHTELGETPALAVNVSDARAMFHVNGAHAREVMAKLCPVDLAPNAFQPGMFRRTRMAQVPAAFWMPDSNSFQVVCFRSQAQYVFDLLIVAAQPGSEVDVYQE